MSFAFKHSDNVASQVRSIVLGQADKALEQIEAGDGFPAAVHQIRKTCKQTRGMLRLVRPCFERYREENEAFKSIAASLSSSRDSSVMVETFTGLFPPGAPYASEDVRPALEEVRIRLDARAMHVHEQTDQQTLLANAAERLRDAKQRINDWSFTEKGVHILLPGLEQSFRKLRRGLERARAEPSAETLHELRKSAKYHWYHVRLWQPAAPDLLSAHASMLDRVGDALGDHHNLAVLREWLETATIGHETLRDTLLHKVEMRQQVLLEEALPLLSQLAAEKPGALGRRYRQYWTLLGERDGR
ncbi:CHAD domain-containing protein [Devosia sp. PTR5]|uniref:CHAD domain-containing protein n=1 Tax=Devosia oryzisoli TaxID=2774138 RepID=A0A927FS08_9HYPH|nr:CHAD domain-containing protein [Devosia oryzisoli]MBD8064362.1 CHAD domain-containing protein [Devosia oryzisoli]